MRIFSVVSDVLTLWTTTLQAPLPMEFFRKNTEVGCHFLLQGIFLTQGSNRHLLCLLHWHGASLPLCQVTTIKPPNCPYTFNCLSLWIILYIHYYVHLHFILRKVCTLILLVTFILLFFFKKSLIPLGFLFFFSYWCTTKSIIEVSCLCACQVTSVRVWLFEIF